MMLHSCLNEHHHAQQTNLATYRHPNWETLTLILKLVHMFLHVASMYWGFKKNNNKNNNKLYIYIYGPIAKFG